MAVASAVIREHGFQSAVSLNPLRCAGTALPPQVLLAAKLIVLGLLLKGYVQRIPGVFVPMLPIFDHLPRPELVQPLLQATVVLFGIALLCNVAVRTSSFAVGLAFMLATLAAQGFYSNGRLYCYSMLMLIGLYAGPWSIWPVRWQAVLLYLGSGLNKLSLSDWRSGQYFEYWMHNIVQNDAYTRLAAVLPPMALSQFFCWATIVTELAIAVGLAVPRWYRLGIWLALLFHFSSVAMTGTIFGIFVIAVTFSLLVFVEWPREGEVAIVRVSGTNLSAWMLRIAERWDFDDVLVLSAHEVPKIDETDSNLVVTWRGRSYSGPGAAIRIALSLPVTYFAAAIALILPSLALRALGY